MYLRMGLGGNSHMRYRTHVPKLRPTTQCHVGPYFRSNSFFMYAAISFSIWERFIATAHKSTASCCISSSMSTHLTIAFNSFISSFPVIVLQRSGLYWINSISELCALSESRVLLQYLEHSHLSNSEWANKRKIVIFRLPTNSLHFFRKSTLVTIHPSYDNRFCSKLDKKLALD